MKRLTISLAILLMCLLCVCAYAEKEGLYSYKLNDDNTVTITGFDWNNNHGDIYIPEMLGNRMVSAIGESAFATTGNTAVKITLPDNIRSIGSQAFRGVSITYVNIPLNTVEIGGGAFAECSVMRFNVADGHTVFATIDNSLYNKQTKTLLAWPVNKEINDIPNGIKSIGDYVFYGRNFNVSSDGWSTPVPGGNGTYTLPTTIENIGEYAFAKTSGLSLKGSGISVIGNHAFEEADLELDAPNISDIGEYAFYKSEITFKSSLSLSIIRKHAFEEGNVTLLKPKGEIASLLSTSPYQIEEYAFYHCDGRSTIRLTNATSIGAHAFEETNQSHNNIKLIFFKEDLQNVTYIGEKALYLACTTTISGGDLVGQRAFIYLTNEKLESIPEDAFSKNVFTDITLNPSIKEIGNSAFSYNPYLVNVELPDGLLTIGDKAFYNCEELTAIHIPASVTMMGNDIFSGCADTFVVTVEAGSYGEVWARTCGYAYVVNGQVEDTSWLD